MMETATYALPDGSTMTYLLDHPRCARRSPPGLVAVHNVSYWTPGFAMSEMGFPRHGREASSTPSALKPCGCTWAPEVGTHYRRLRK